LYRRRHLRGYELNSANFSLKKKKITGLQIRIPLAIPPKIDTRNSKNLKKMPKIIFLRFAFPAKSLLHINKDEKNRQKKRIVVES